MSSRKRYRYDYHKLGTPLKSLAKTQAALFGVVFISTLILSSILTFAQTNDSINETVQQIVETLTGDNSSDNSTEATADIILPPQNETPTDNSTTNTTSDAGIGSENITLPSGNMTNETNVSQNLTLEQNLTILQNLTNSTNLTDNNTTNTTLTNLTNQTGATNNTNLTLEKTKKSKKLITKFNNKLKIKGKNSQVHAANIEVFADDDNSTDYEVNIQLTDTKKVKRIKINNANLNDKIGDADINLFEINDDPQNAAVAVNPLINYSTAQVTLDLIGDIRKCAKWDFATDTCNGDWVIVKKFSGGQFETTITPDDPAWINSTSTINVSYTYAGEYSNFSSVAADINDSSVFYFHPFDNASSPQNLTAFWGFDEGVGSKTAQDLTGTGNTGWDNADRAAMANMTFGNNFNVGNGNRFVEVNSSALLGNITNQTTVEAWIYPTSNTTWGVVEKSINQAVNTQFLLFHDTTNFVQFRVVKGGSLYTSTSASIGDVSLNQWHYIVGRFDGNITRVTVDGVNGSSTTVTGGSPIDSNAGNLTIGRLYTGGSYNFFGSIDEVAIWNRSLSDAEILEHYQKKVAKIGSSGNRITLNISQGANFTGEPDTNITSYGNLSVWGNFTLLPNTNWSFDDFTNIGITQGGSGNLNLLGNVTHSVKMQSVKETPTTKWKADPNAAMSWRANYANFTNHNSMYTRTGSKPNINNTYFHKGGQCFDFVSGGNPENFENNTIVDCTDSLFFENSVNGNVKNVTILRSVGQDILLYSSSKAEIFNSSFSESKVSFQTGTPTFISVSHKNVNNNYMIFTSVSVAKSAISNDFNSTSNVTIYTGRLDVDESASADNITINNGGVFNESAGGQTITLTGGLNVLNGGQFNGTNGQHTFGWLTANSGGNVNLTAGNTTITSGSDTNLGGGVSRALGLSGTVVHNNGTVILAVASGTTRHITLKDAAGSNPLNNLDFNNSGAYITSGSANWKLKINGNLSLRHPSAIFVNSNNGRNPWEVGGLTTIWGELRAGSGANANFIFNDSVTINSGGRFGSPSVAEGTNYSTTIRNGLTINAGGTFSASTLGAFNITGGSLTTTGNFTHNDGTITFAVPTSPTTTFGSATYYGILTLGGNSYVTPSSSSTVNIVGFFNTSTYIPLNPSTITLGNSTRAGYMSMSGAGSSFTYMNAAGTVTIQGNNTAFPATVAGTDINWGYAGSGRIWNLKYLNYSIVSSTGANPVTINLLESNTFTTLTVTAGATFNADKGNFNATGNLVVNAGGTFNAPNSTSNFNFSGSSMTINGNFTHNDGTVTIARASGGNQDFQPTGGTTGDVTFFNIEKFGSSIFRMYKNATIVGSLNISADTGYVQVSANNGPTIITMGNSTRAGSINTAAVKINFAGNTVFPGGIEGNDTVYPYVAAGSDWNWDGGGSGSLVNIKNGNLAFGSTTGGGGVTLNFTGNMTTQQMVISSGDTLNISTPGTIITGTTGSGGVWNNQGTLNILPATPNVTIWNTETIVFGGVSRVRYLNYSSAGINNGYATQIAGGNVNISDSTIIERTGTFTGIWITGNSQNVDIRNTLIDGGDGTGGYLRNDIAFNSAGAGLQCRNCTFGTKATIGFNTVNNWFVSRDDNYVQNDWRIYGALNSTDANATLGYQASNWTSSTNVTLMNGTVYTTAFPTVYNISESATVGNITVQSGNLNITGAVNVTILQNLTTQVGSANSNISIDADNVTVFNQITINSGGNLTLATQRRNTTLIVGTPTAQGTIINDGYIGFKSNTGSSAPTIQGASDTFKAFVRGTDPDWDSGGSGSIVNLKFADLRVRTITGGGGVTLNITDNTTYRAIQISAGDTLQLITPGTNISSSCSGCGASEGYGGFRNAGNFYVNGNATHPIIMFADSASDTTAATAVYNWNYSKIDVASDHGINMGGAINLNSQYFNNVSFYSGSSQAGLLVQRGLGRLTIYNSSFNGANNGGYATRDIALGTNAAGSEVVILQCQNCSFNTVGIEGSKASGLISKDHRGIVNDWRIYGALNSTDANATTTWGVGFRASNWTSSTNVTIMNATVYATAFPTVYNLTESATVGNITVQSGNLNITGAVNITITQNLTTQVGSANSNITLNADNVTVWNQTTINSGGTLRLMPEKANSTLILGTTTRAATLINSGALTFSRNTGSQVATINGADTVYPFVATGSDWDWDGGGSGSIVNMKNGNLGFDTATGGSGVTVNFTGNMTIDEFTVSAGDTLNISTPGTIITGSGQTSGVSISGNLYILPAAPNVTMNNIERLVLGARDIRIRYLNFSSSGTAQGYGIEIAGNNINISDSSITQTTATYAGLFVSGGNDVTGADIRNTLIDGGDGTGGYLRNDVALQTGTKIQCRNCSFNTVGFQGTAFLVSRDHNYVQNDWRIWGALNSTDANATLGYRASNWTSSTNVTIMNGTVYSTAFPTVYNISESATVGNITVQSGNLNITGAVNVTILQNLTTQVGSANSNITINADNVTVWNQTTISANTNFTISGEKANSTFIIGSPATPGTLINNGVLRFTANTGSNVPHVRASNNEQPFTAYGNDWDWDNGGSGSIINIKNGIYRPALVSGGGGVTLNFTGNMTFPTSGGLIITAGDTFNVTEPGTNVSGAGSAAGSGLQCNGNCNWLGSTSMPVRIGGLPAGSAAWQTISFNGASSIINVQYVQFVTRDTAIGTTFRFNSGANAKYLKFDNFTYVGGGSNDGMTFNNNPTAQIPLLSNCTISGADSSSWFQQDVVMENGFSRVEFDRCSFNTVGFQGNRPTSIISRHHNNVTNDWRIYGVMNSTDANATYGLRASNFTSSTNLTIANGTVYSVAFPTVYNISESTTVGNITVQSGNLNITGAVNVTITQNLTTQVGSANSNITLNADNVTVWNQTTINSGGTLRLMPEKANSTLILGTTTKAATIINSGTLTFNRNTGSQVATINGADTVYPFVATGTDWDWDGGGSGSVVNIKNGDLGFDATTGGGGVTVNYTGNMTVDAITVTAGDTWNVTTPGIAITGNPTKIFSIRGSLMLKGSATSHVNMSGQLALVFYSFDTVDMQYANVTGVNYGIEWYPTAGTITRIDNIIFTGTTYAGIFNELNGGITLSITNSTAVGSGGAAWNQRDVMLATNTHIQISSSNFTTVGMQSASGWLVSKNHNNVLNDWRIYGALNSTDANASLGYQAANWTSSTNVTLMNATAYSTSFPTVYNITESATVGNITIQSGNLNITGAVNVTILQNLTTQQNSYFANISIDADNVTVGNQITINTNGNLTLATQRRNTTLIVGTATAQGTILNDGYIGFKANTGSSAPAIQGAANNFPAFMRGNDPDWDSGGSGSTVNLKFVDNRIASATGGGGVTINVTDNTTIRSFLISAGDTMQLLNPGTNLTSSEQTNSNGFIRAAGNFYTNGNATAPVSLFYGVLDTNGNNAVFNMNNTIGNCGRGSCSGLDVVHTLNGNNQYFNNITLYGGGASAALLIEAGTGTWTFYNSSFYSPDGSGWTLKDIAFGNAGLIRVQCQNCTYNTVGIHGANFGSLISKHDNNNVNKWVIYGALNSTDGNATIDGWRAGNWTSATNVTIANATQYNTAFPTVYNISESATVGNITVQSGNLNFTGNINVAILQNLTSQQNSYFNNITIAADNVTVWNQTTLNANTNLTLRTTERNASFYIGSPYRAGTIINNGFISFKGNTGANVATIEGADTVYPFVATGTDWDWDGGGSGSVVNIKNGDLGFDATTGGGGVTVNYTGNMTVDGFTVSASDRLNATTPGTTITNDANNKLLTVSGTFTATGASGNNVKITSAQNSFGITFGNTGTVDWQYVNVTTRDNNNGQVVYFGTTPTVTKFDNVIIDATTGAGTRYSPIGLGSTINTFTGTNCTFTGGSGGTGWQTQHTTISAGAKVQFSNCNFTTVGMQATNGWLVSKNHNNVTDDWRIYGTLNSSDANASLGYRASNWTSASNITIANATIYSTAFPTVYNISESATVGNITVQSGNLNITGAVNVTILQNLTTQVGSANSNISIDADNVTVWNQTTINSGGTLRLMPEKANSTFILGTPTKAASIINSGTLTFSRNTGSQVATINGADTVYPFVATGTDWDWDGGGSGSLVNMKNGDMRFDSTTGGGGVTVNYTGNMTIDGFTVSAGDILNITAQNTTVTGSTSKSITINGRINILGRVAGRVNLTNYASFVVQNGAVVNWENADFTTGAGSASGVQFGSGATSVMGIINIENISARSGTSSRGLYVNTEQMFAIKNSTFVSADTCSSWSTCDIIVGTGSRFQCDGCIYNTLGLQGARGWVISRNHSGVSNDWKIYGALNSSDANASLGYRLSNASSLVNLTISNVTSYSTAFPTVYNISESATVGNITIQSGNLNITGAVNVTILQNLTTQVGSANSNISIDADNVTVWNQTTINSNGNLTISGRIRNSTLILGTTTRAATLINNGILRFVSNTGSNVPVIQGADNTYPFIAYGNDFDWDGGGSGSKVNVGNILVSGFASTTGGGGVTVNVTGNYSSNRMFTISAGDTLQAITPGTNLTFPLGDTLNSPGIRNSGNLYTNGNATSSIYIQGSLMGDGDNAAVYNMNFTRIVMNGDHGINIDNNINLNNQYFNNVSFNSQALGMNLALGTGILTIYNSSFYGVSDSIAIGASGAVKVQCQNCTYSSFRIDGVYPSAFISKHDNRVLNDWKIYGTANSTDFNATTQSEGWRAANWTSASNVTIANFSTNVAGVEQTKYNITESATVGNITVQSANLNFSGPINVTILQNLSAEMGSQNANISFRADNVTTRMLAIQPSTTIRLDAVNARRNVTLYFRDVSGAGFSPGMNGTLQAIGTQSANASIKSLSENPTNRWEFGNVSASPMTVILNYANISHVSNVQLSGTKNINNTIFKSVDGLNGVWLHTNAISNFNNVTIDNVSSSANSALRVESFGFTNFTNIVVVNNLGESDIDAFAVRLEFNNSNFATNKVYVREQGNVISDNHNDLANEYDIWASALTTDAITTPFRIEDHVRLLAGNVSITELTNLTNLTTSAGTRINSTLNLTVLGNISSSGNISLTNLTINDNFTASINGTSIALFRTEQGNLTLFNTTGQFVNITNLTTIGYATINITYTNTTITGINEDNIYLYKSNGTAFRENWTQVTDATINRTANWAYANLTSFSIFSLLASTIPVPPSPPAEAVTAAGSTTLAVSGETVVTFNTEEGVPKTIPVSESSGLTSITLTTIQSLPGVTLTITTAQPTNIPAPEGEINRYVSIKEKNIMPFQINAVKIKFKVSKSWLTEHSASPENIVLTRWDGTKWTDLPTVQIDSDNVKYIYEAESPGLSIYAVVAKVYIRGVTKLDLSAKLRQLKNAVSNQLKDIQDTINFAKERGIPIEEIFPMFDKLKEKFTSALNAEKLGNLATALVLFQDAGDFANTTATTLKSTIETQFGQLIAINQMISYAIFLLVALMLYDKRRIFFNILGDMENLIKAATKRISMPKMPSLKAPKPYPVPVFKPAPPPKISAKPLFKAPSFKLPTFKAPKISFKLPSLPKFSAPSFKAPSFKMPSLPKPAPKPQRPFEIKPRPLEIEERAEKKYEMPKVKLPSFKLPRISLPKFAAPKLSLPSFRLPKVSLPKISMPKFTAPKFSVPKLKLPSLPKPKPVPMVKPRPVEVYEKPSLKAPSFKLPKLPSFKTPKISIPKFKSPSIRLPTFKMPKFKLPSMPAPKPMPVEVKPTRPAPPSKPLFSLPKIEIEFKPASARKKEKK